MGAVVIGCYLVSRIARDEIVAVLLISAFFRIMPHIVGQILVGIVNASVDYRHYYVSIAGNPFLPYGHYVYIGAAY